ncbi:hypothetical protein BH09BAC4_BH09BAC4_40720 [soil metagenome]
MYEKSILDKLTLSQIDSIIAVAKSPENRAQDAMFSSKEDLEFKLGNARLIISSDDKLISYFQGKKNDFERIKELIIENDNHTKGDTSAVEIPKNLKDDYKKLFISFVPTKDYDFKNCIEFVIGGIGDNVVGYVYIPTKKDLPQMSADHIIMLREMGEGWYLYKTT